MLRRLFHFLALVILLLTLAAARAAEAARPNILLIMADDLRCALGCYGDAQAKTPHLDRLAARGVRFERAYVQYPVCNPSRTSLMLGLRPSETRITSNAVYFRTLHPEIVTLPQQFRAHGWEARSFGKIYHAGNTGNDTQMHLTDIGKSWNRAEMFRPTDAGRKGDVRNLSGGRLPWCDVGRMEGTDDDQPDGQTARQAIAAIEELSAAGKPWFIAAGFHRPHDPFVVPKNNWDLFPDGSLKLPADPEGASPPGRWTIGGAAWQDQFATFTDRDRMDFLHAYYAGIAMTDAQTGRLMDALERLKLWESTIVVFMGDHGFHLGERGWWNKNTLYERSCRVPFIVCAPGAAAGVRSGIAEAVDLYPTLLDCAGLPAPHKLAGQSLHPVLSDPNATPKDAAFSTVVRSPEVTGQSVRTARWRYTEWAGGTAGSELYDHDRDTGEWHDLAGDSSHAGTIKSLKARLATPDKWEKEITGVEARLRDGKHPPGGVVFAGSSTMRMWDLKKWFPGRDFANAGFGGSTMADNVRYFDRLLAPLRPAQVFLYCGGNDIAGGRSPQQVEADFKAWLRLYRRLAPQGRVVVLSIRPCESRAKSYTQEVEANRLLRAVCEADPDNHCTFIDTEPTVRTQDGKLRTELFLPDNLHLNDAGYDVWTKLVQPMLPPP